MDFAAICSEFRSSFFCCASFVCRFLKKEKPRSSSGCEIAIAMIRKSRFGSFCCARTMHIRAQSYILQSRVPRLAKNWNCSAFLSPCIRTSRYHRCLCPTHPHRRLYPTRLHRRSYSNSHPPIVSPRWLYATDIPLSKPHWLEYKQEKTPQKYVAFSASDESRLEAAYQAYKLDTRLPHSIDVNEDHLFCVNIEKLVILPVYWDGPVFEVRRSIWFTRDGIPLPNTLSETIEKGYLAKKPYAFAIKQTTAAAVKDSVRKFNAPASQKSLQNPSLEDHKPTAITPETEPDLFLIENGKLVLFFDRENAAIIPESFATQFHLGIIRNIGPSRVLLLSVEYIRRGLGGSGDDLVLNIIPSNPVGNFFKDKGAGPELDGGAISGNVTTDLANENEDSDTLPRKAGVDQGPRKIDHLVLCVHGIGQMLGSRFDSVNFAHSINVLRTKMKSEFKASKSLRKIVYQQDFDSQEARENNRVQILPISWRHKINFHPQKSALRDDKGLSRLPSLSQLNLEGVMPIRNIMGEVVLDILLYYEPKYLDMLLDAVLDEINRVYRLFCERNPDFKGQVHILGHSLGSAIAFDILARQPISFGDSSTSRHELCFPVESFFCLGSPVGMFKLLQQRNVIARKAAPACFDPLSKSCTIASPRCRNLYNIFHPCDPIAYRIEPLVRPRVHAIKPDLIPSSSKSIFNDQILDIGEGISEKFNQASSWFSSTKKLLSPDPNHPQVMDNSKSVGNGLQDLWSSMSYSGETPLSEQTYEKEIMGQELQPLIDLNRTGRVDYSLKPGVFQLSLVSAFSAHVSYFEDDDTAAFLLKQIITGREENVRVKTVKVQKPK